jgi:NADH:ubiquinone oxidoreductase subunit 2 (subunit N)
LFTALGSEGLFFLLFCGLSTAIISCYYYLRVAKLLFYESYSTFFFCSTFTYSAAFMTGFFFFFNCLFLFYSYILDDISLYVSICLYLCV